MQGMGAHKPVVLFPSVLSGPLRSSVVLDMILSMEKAKGFGEESTALLGSSLGQDMTVSRGKELAIASFSCRTWCEQRPSSVSPAGSQRIRDTTSVLISTSLSQCHPLPPRIYIQMTISGTIASRGSRLMLIN